MKTLIETSNPKVHAIINSNCYVKYHAVDKPVWHDEKSGLAKTENVIRDVDIFIVGENGLTFITLSHHAIKEMAKKIDEVITAETEPDFPEY